MGLPLKKNRQLCAFKNQKMNIKLIAIGKTDNKALQTLIDSNT